MVGNSHFGVTLTKSLETNVVTHSTVCQLTRDEAGSLAYKKEMYSTPYHE